MQKINIIYALSVEWYFLATIIRGGSYYYVQKLDWIKK